VQFIKYVLAGGVATAVDGLVFYAMSWKILPAMRSDDPLARWLRLKVHDVAEDVRSRRFVINTIVAFLFSNLTAYLINIVWVFKPGRHTWWMELLMFYAVSGMAIAIGTLLGWFCIRRMHFSTTFSYVTKGISALLINFVCRKFIIFRG
jgi:putative flippase GtrA